MITRIEAYGYRCFPELGVDLDRYHVLAGANGAGKTTLLDIPVLIGDMLRRQRGRRRIPRTAGSRPRGPGQHPHRPAAQGRGDAIAFAFEARLPPTSSKYSASTSMAQLGRPVPTHLRYELQAGGHPARPCGSPTSTCSSSPKAATGRTRRSRSRRAGLESKSRNRLTPQARRLAAGASTGRAGRSPSSSRRSTTQPTDIPPLGVSSRATGLGTVPPDQTLFPAALWFASLLRGGVVFFDPDWETLRRPAPPGHPETAHCHPGRTCPGSPSTCRTRPGPVRVLDRSRPHGAAAGQVTSERSEREEDHYAYFSVEYNGGYRVTSSGLSDGTLRILALTLLPFLGEEVMPRLLVTEEPENGIHPRAIETVVQSLSMLYDSQVWVSTHSPIVLAHTELRDVLATRLDKDGSVTVVAGDKHPRLRDWQGTLDIGTLFAAGVLS